MAMLKAALLLALTLFATNPALAQDRNPEGGEEAPSLDVRERFYPRMDEIQTAFDALDTGPKIGRSYVVHDARCKVIGPIETRKAVACRLDFTMTDTVPQRKVTRYRDDCTRFTLERDGWRILQERDPPPCEMPSVLKRDPAPLPKRDDVEAALLADFQCHDGPDYDCFIYVEKVTLDSAVCTPIAPDSEGKPRVACRVSGQAGYTSRRPAQRFDAYCIRLRRYSERGVTPGNWGWSYEEGDDAKPCQARSRGTDILR